MKKIAEGKSLLLLSRGDWEFAERRRAKEAVAIVAVTPAGELLLTEQHRHPVDAPVIDLPAGLVGDEEGHQDPEESAKKELLEETGFRCADVELLARGPSSPGITSEIVSLYRAEGLQRQDEGGGVEGESITVLRMPLASARQWLEQQERQGKLIDLKVWSALHFARPPSSEA